MPPFWFDVIWPPCCLDFNLTFWTISGCVLFRTEQTAEHPGDRQRRRSRSALEPLLNGPADRNIQEPQIWDRRPSNVGGRVVPDYPVLWRRKTCHKPLGAAWLSRNFCSGAEAVERQTSAMSAEFTRRVPLVRDAGEVRGMGCKFHISRTQTKRDRNVRHKNA